MKKLYFILFSIITTYNYSVAQTCTSATVFGGPGVDQLGKSHAVSASGATYIASSFVDSALVIQGHRFESIPDDALANYDYNYFVMKLDSNNNFEWFHRIHGDYDNRLLISRLTTDADDNVYILAGVQGQCTFAGHTFDIQDNFAYVVIKLSPDGDYLWHTYMAYNSGNTNEFVNDHNGSIAMITILAYGGVYFKYSDGTQIHHELPTEGGALNCIFALNQYNGRLTYFEELRDDIGLINGDLNLTAQCDIFMVNDQLYFDAYYYEPDSSSYMSKIFKCTGGIVEQVGYIKGSVYAMFGSPVDGDHIYTHIKLGNQYYTRKYTTDFSQIVAEGVSEHTYLLNTQNIGGELRNFFVDESGYLTTVVNPMVPNWFTYNGNSVYPNNNRMYALLRFSPELELVGFKSIIPGWDYENFHDVFYNRRTNTFKLVGNGRIDNEIDGISYHSEGYEMDYIILEFDNVPIIENAKPVANAGNNLKRFEGDTIILSGLNSTDADGDSLRYTWTVEPSEGVSFDDPQSATPTFLYGEVSQPPADFPAGNPWSDIYTITLVVNDGKAKSEPHSIQVGIRADITPPVVVIEEEWHVNEGETIVFDASGSYDPDINHGNALTYTWQIMTDEAGLEETDAATCSFTAPEVDRDRIWAVIVKAKDAKKESEEKKIRVHVHNVLPSIEVPLYMAEGQPANKDTVTLLFLNYDIDTEKWKAYQRTEIDNNNIYALFPGRWKVYAIPTNPSQYNFIPTYAEGVTTFAEAQEFTLDPTTELATRIECIPIADISGEGSITGNVTEMKSSVKSSIQDTPQPNTIVVLYAMPDKKPVAYTITDASGGYTFSGLPYGTYYLTADKTGFDVPGITVELSEDTQTITGADINYNSANMISVIHEQEKYEVLIFPNPAHHEVYIKSLLPITRVEAYSLSGAKVLQTINTNRIDISALQQGMYLLKVTAGNKTMLKRIIKK